jgi:rhodanese-related sulfurtransferase
MLQDNPKSVLLDVRTCEELTEVGHPGTDADDPSYGRFLEKPVPRVFHVPWEEPRGTLNPHFLDTVEKLFAKDTPILNFCRTANRSGSSCQLLESEGFTNTYNINYGFEGKDSNGVFHEGWRGENLPWNQNDIGTCRPAEKSLAIPGTWRPAEKSLAVPLPGGLLLLSSGLVRLAACGIRRRKS